METICILNAFVSSVKQYELASTESNLLNLQRHLDAMIAITASSSIDDHFNPSSLPVSESFHCFIDIILHNFDKQELVRRVFTVLTNLVKSEIVLHSLQSSFHLHNVLCTFLWQRGINVSDELVLQCLHLMEHATKDVNISYVDRNMGHVIQSLIKEIDNKSVIYVTALHILANFFRHNPTMQEYFKKLPNKKEVSATLASALRLKEPQFLAIIYTVSILASLTENTEKRQQMFTEKQLRESIEIIVRQLVSSDEFTSNAALNLFFDLLEIPYAPQVFFRYEKLSTAFKKITDTYVGMMSSEKAAKSSIYLKLLWVFAKAPESRRKVLKVLIPPNDKIHPILCDWCTETTDSAGEAQLHALKIMKVLVENLDDESFQSLEICFQEIAHKLLNSVPVCWDTKSSCLKEQYDIQVALFDLLISFCKKETLRNFISEHIDIQKCQNIIKSQFDGNTFLSYKENDCSESGSDLLLITLALVATIKDLDPAANAFLNLILQEPKFRTFVAHGLSSTCVEHVKRSFLVLSVIKEDVPLTLLGENLSEANDKRQQSKLSEMKENITTGSNSVCSACLENAGEAVQRRPCSERNVEILIKKINNGLDLQDLKLSEILDVYECQIAALTAKETELRSLLEAKSHALQQAEHVLSRYQWYHAKKETEALKLRKVVQDAQQRCETAEEDSARASKKCLELQVELESVQQHVSALKQLNSQQRDFINDLNERIIIHEKENKNLRKQLTERDSKIKECEEEIQKIGESLKKKNEEYQALELSKGALEKSFKESEKENERLRQEIKMREMACEQHEVQIKEKDAINRNLTDQLEKMKHITDMIHAISSGKVPDSISGLQKK